MYKWIVVNGKAIEVEKVTYDKGEGNRKKTFYNFHGLLFTNSEVFNSKIEALQQSKLLIDRQLSHV